MNYFALNLLASEWHHHLVGSLVIDIWTQSANELSVALEKEGAKHTIRILCDPKLPLLFRAEGYGRAKSNSATLFPEIHSEHVSGIRTADRDRFLIVETKEGSSLQVQLFGSRPNVLWVENGMVRDSFLTATEWVGRPAPPTRPAPEIESFTDFEAHWPTSPRTAVQALAATMPLLGRDLATEVVFRASVDASAKPAELGEVERLRLYEAVLEVEGDLRAPQPTVYWRGAFAQQFSLIPLRSASPFWRTQSFDAVDTAMAVFSKRSLAQRRFMKYVQPLESALTKAHAKAGRRADAMLAELENKSRADAYEAWAHLLMAQAANQGAGQNELTLPDILNDGEAVTIKLDPALTVVENAQRFYAKARQTREARRHTEERWASVQAQAEKAKELLQGLRSLERFTDLETFLTANKVALAQYTRPEAIGEERLPYRRFEIQGWEIRVGKSAKSNAELTTKLSGPHDLWLHARGVSGSHVVIRRPNKTADVPKSIVEAAARIAAHFSDAKSQPLAPVIVTERKYVRPVKGGAPGLVRVDREDVVMVEPGLPSE